MDLHDAIVKSFKDKFGHGPRNPIEFAHNLPPNASDNDAMAAMVKFMQQPNEPEQSVPIKKSNKSKIFWLLWFFFAGVAIVSMVQS